MSFLFLVPSSMLSTVSALGAQEYRVRNKPKRAVDTLRYAAFLAAGFGCVVAVVIQFWAEPVVSLFTDATTAEGAEVVRLGGPISPGLCMGLHFCWCAFLFQRIFLCRGKIRHFFPAQHYRHCPYAYSRRLLDFYAVPHNAAPDGISSTASTAPSSLW
ncbi:MAG: MATE family efflux transporter [Clostridia bacterium]